jgi:alpha-beta hydrolase superfamily lysophospholipase
MKIYLFLLAFLLAGCAGSGSPNPLPTSIPQGKPTSTPEETATQPPAEPTDSPTISPTETLSSEAPYPAVESADNSDNSPYPAAQPAAADSPYPAPGQGPATFPGAGDLPISGELHLPENVNEPWPGILLLHMLGSDKDAWGDVPSQLAEAGYAVLAIDMRGHGETGGSIDWESAEEDHQRALEFLAGVPGVDASRLAVVGASIGSNLALRAGADSEAVRTVILLSPGLDYQGVTTEGALSEFGDRPLLILASSEDTYAAESSETLADQAVGEVELEMYQDAGHGTEMIAGEPSLVDKILDWLGQIME